MLLLRSLGADILGRSCREAVTRERRRGGEGDSTSMAIDGCWVGCRSKETTRSWLVKQRDEPVKEFRFVCLRPPALTKSPTFLLPADRPSDICEDGEPDVPFAWRCYCGVTSKTAATVNNWMELSSDTLLSKSKAA